MNDKEFLSGTKFRKIFEEGPIGIALVRLDDFGFDFVNKRLCEILGYKEDELLKLSFPEVTFLDDKSNDMEKTKKLIAGKIPFYQIEKRYIKKNNELFWVSVTASLVQDENHILKMVEDINKRKLVEEQLKASESRYRALAKNFPNGAVVLFDKNLKFLLVDGKILAEIGLSKKRMEGKTIYEVFSKEVCEIVEPHYKDALKGIESVFEIPFTNRIFELHVVPIKDKSNNVIAGMAMAQDITESREHIRELQEMNKNKDKFFSIIGHDLRSPFSNLLGLTQFLADDIDELSKEEIEEFSKGIYISAKSVFELLDNLLEWSRIQTGRIPFEPSAFSIKSLIEEIETLFRANAENKNLDIIIDIDGEPHVYADRNMINTVFRNLISNAIKFSNPGGKILIEAWKHNNLLNIAVIDSGIGIPAENIQRLFKIEEHISSKGTSGERGTGLGLILTKEFINKNNGGIEVESEPGIGSKFTVTLPMRHAY